MTEPVASTPLLLLRAMRPRQWTKNVLLLAGLFFSRSLLDPVAIGRALAGLVIFCLLSGAIYLINDVTDAPMDRLHPSKRHRPIASGRLSSRLALHAALLLIVLGFVGSYALSVHFLICSAAYVLMMISYTLLLKLVFLIDALMIAMGFVIRAVSGVIVLRTPQTPVPLTSWFIVCVMFLSLFLAFAKRRSERVRLDREGWSTRPVLGQYSPELLDRMITVCCAGAILSYTLYSTTVDTPWMMMTTLPFVLFGIFRYLHLVYNTDDGEAPEVTLTRDPPLLGCIALWLVSLVVVYLPAG